MRICKAPCMPVPGGCASRLVRAATCCAITSHSTRLPPLPQCRPTAAAQLAALCAGHWEAVQALAAAAEPGGGLDLATEDDFSVLLKAYHRMASTCPFLATPTFFTPLIQAMDRV